MPSVKARGEDKLLELFLTVYEDRSWAGALSRIEYPERVRDGGVELIAKQIATGRTLAIEHTVIEPFIGEKKDFFENFQELAHQLRSDDALKEPGVALYVDVPVNVLPKGVPWQPIINDVKAFLLVEKSTFGVEKEMRQCPSPHHPLKTISLQVRRQPLDRTMNAFVIVQRHGEMRIQESVRKALEKKLPKLVATDVDSRILILERDQGFLDSDAILGEVRSLRASFPALEQVHQIWICDTATFGTSREWVEFTRWQDGRHVESFAFFQGKLQSIGRNGMPVPLM